jgi:CII-binding regulator of phage lambda lysogenization HflD
VLKRREEKLMRKEQAISHLSDYLSSAKHEVIHLAHLKEHLKLKMGSEHAPSTSTIRKLLKKELCYSY